VTLDRFHRDFRLSALVDPNLALGGAFHKHRPEPRSTNADLIVRTVLRLSQRVLCTRTTKRDLVPLARSLEVRMAGSQRAPKPNFFVGDDDKEAMAEQFLAQSVFSIERLASEPNAPLADDLLDIIARAAAAVLSADTHLNTPGKLRQGAETVAAHTLRHLKRYKAEEAETGVAALHRILATNPIPDEMKRYWNDS
jgi:hypothetical protein